MSPWFPPDAEPRPPWTIPFIEVTLRALTLLHFKALPSDLPNHPDLLLHSKLVNVGIGLRALDERYVCQEIFDQLSQSPLVKAPRVRESGSFKVLPGPRTYWVSREAPYPTNQRLHTDLRVDLIDESTSRPIKRPAFIEAKRARLFEDGLGARETSQKQAVREDVRKLRDLEQACDGSENAPRGYVLIWDITSTTESFATEPFEYLDQCLDGQCTAWQIRWAPLSLTNRQSPSISGAVSGIDQLLWVALVEVTPPEPSALRQVDT